MSKVILFSRVSTMGQDLTQQNDELLNEAKRNGYNEKQIILIEQKESGIKLDEDEREGIRQLKEAIEKYDVECVIIYEISRLARRPTVLYSIRDYLIERGVNLICMKPYMRLLDTDGKMSQTASILFSLFGALSESEMMIKKERMNRGRISKREKGKYIGGNILFGYMHDEETDVIYVDESKRDTVIEIFERYVKCESLRQISKDLMDRGLLHYENYSTAEVMMRRMINRSEYAGIKGSTYDYPSIISQELFYKVRQRAESRNKYKTRTKSIYLLQGIIRLKHNGMLMTPVRPRNVYRAWDENINAGTMINMEYINSIALMFVKKYKDSISGDEKIVMFKRLFEEMQKNTQRQRTSIEEHNKVKETIERINERIVKGKMTEEQGDRMIEEQQKRIKELDNIMKKCSEDMKHLEHRMKTLQEDAHEDIENMNDEQKQKLIRECITKILIEKDIQTKTCKWIDIYMVDGTIHHLHLIKPIQYQFKTYIILKNGNEKLIDERNVYNKHKKGKE